MGRFFTLNPGLAVPAVIIVAWLAAFAASRCFLYLSRKVGAFFATKMERPPAPLERPLAEGTE